MPKRSMRYTIYEYGILTGLFLGAGTIMAQDPGLIQYESTAKDAGRITIPHGGKSILQASFQIVKKNGSNLNTRDLEQVEIRVNSYWTISQAQKRPPDDLRTEPSPAETHVLELSVMGAEGVMFNLQGQFSGEDMFPCSPDETGNQQIPLRSLSGFSLSRLNTGVYSRAEDWAVMFQTPNPLQITSGRSRTRGTGLYVNIQSPVLTIYFKPDLYKRHRGIAWFEPSQYAIRELVPAGWISWKAYGASVTEAQIRSVADWAAEKLVPYGLEYLIIDDGWFGGSDGSMMHNAPAQVDWTQANQRFPGGVKSLADYIHGKKMKLGLWLSPFGFSGDTSDHPDWWVRKSREGEIIHNVWHGEVYADASVPEALNQWLLPGFRALSADGADYFKVDGQMHVAYEAYAPGSDYFNAKGTTWQEAYRQGWEAIRGVAGDRYILSCWSRIPQNVGFPDAMRIGGDKDSSWNHILEVAQDLAHWYHEHNILWCADPDHLVWKNLSPAECRTWATLVGLTGVHLTISDPPEALDDEKLNILRRILPVMSQPMTRPGELYYRAEAPALWSLEINRSYDQWLVVANTHVGSVSVEKIFFSDLGLDPSIDYMIYDYWNHEYKGIHRESYACGIPPEHDVQVYAIRATRPHPWVVSESRHISQGGIFLQEVTFKGKTLSGQSLLTAGEPYILSIACNGSEPQNAESSAGTARLEKKENDAVDLILENGEAGVVEWKVVFAK